MSERLTNPIDAFRAACSAGRLRDIGEAALLLGALDHPGEDLGPYRAHLADLAALAQKHHDVEEAAVRGQILADIMWRDFGYEGDDDLFGRPEISNLLNVITRRAGLPVLLGVLYLHMARAAGWRAAGVAFPGQFLVQVDGEDGVSIIDPFDEGREMQHADLYSLLHRVSGRMARLEEHHLEPVTDAAVFIRILSNQKAIAARNRDIPRVLEVLERMLIVRPNEPAYLYEQARLLRQDGRPGAAKRKFEAVIALDPQTPYAERSLEDLAGLKRQLN